MTESQRPFSPDVDAESKQRAPRKRRIRLVVFLLLVLGGAAWGTRYYLEVRHFESTDNAFIDATIVQVAPQVAGAVQKVYVKENQHVDQGAMLVDIDPAPYKVKLEQAQAAQRLAQAQQQTAQLNVGLTETTSGAGVEQAQALVAAAEENVARARAGLTAAQAEAERAQRDYQRYEQLGEAVIAKQQRDQAAAAARVTSARVQEAREQVSAAEAQVQAARGQLAEAQSAPQQVSVRSSEVETRGAEIEQAGAAVRAAELNLSYTQIKAPIAGHVTRKSVDEGEFVQPGQNLMAIVADDYWVTANYKETQLEDMRIGQPVDLEIDAYPNVTFHGKVESIQSGSGARFSLLPPENATGNYVKVVQRVPVKIVFTEAPGSKYKIGPGMSVVPKVRVR